MKKFTTEQKAIITFLVRFGGILLVWQIIYLSFLENGWIDITVTKYVSEVSIYMLNLVGYDIDSYLSLSGHQVLVQNGSNLLSIAHNCNGLILYVLFAAFVVNFPGKKSQKFTFILFGIIALFLINCFRVVGLALTQMYQPSWTDFSHKYLYTFIVYAFELWLWMIYINRFSRFKKTT